MRYFWETIRHKWFVLLSGVKLRVPFWLLLIHDWSKFLPSELPHYNKQFFGSKDDPLGFAIAWLYHQNRHPHHPEFWITCHDHSHGESVDFDGCLPMPDTYVKEMIADWMGASMVHTGSWDMTEWLAKELPKKRFHPETRGRAETKLEKMGYDMTSYRASMPRCWREYHGLEVV